jgi:hypothetical protein
MRRRAHIYLTVSEVCEVCLKKSFALFEFGDEHDINKRIKACEKCAEMIDHLPEKTSLYDLKGSMKEEW